VNAIERGFTPSFLALALALVATALHGAEPPALGLGWLATHQGPAYARAKR